MALTCDPPQSLIPLLISHDRAPTWLMSGIPMSPGGIWSLYMLGGGEGGDDGLGVLVACHSGQLACLRASSPWPQGHTVQRPSRRDAWNWAVDCLKAKDPSLLVRGRRAWAPPKTCRQARQAEMEVSIFESRAQGQGVHVCLARG